MSKTILTDGELRISITVNCFVERQVVDRVAELLKEAGLEADAPQQAVKDLAEAVEDAVLDIESDSFLWWHPKHGVVLYGVYDDYVAYDEGCEKLSEQPY